MNRARLTAFAGLALVVAVCWSAESFGQDKAGPPADKQGAFDQAKAMAEMQKQFMQQFDVDKDGKLNAQENMMAQEAMRRQGINMGIAPSGFPGADQFSAQFDRDGDGKLNAMEAAMAQQAFQRMRRGGNGTGGPQVGGGGGSSLAPPLAPVAPAGDGKPAKVNPLVKRFDKDGDGKLNDAEKAAAQAELKKDKSKEKEKDAKKDKDKAAKKDK
jgi:hypothetical protein